MVSFQGACGAGGFQRRSPVGGAANGMPRNVRVESTSVPSTVPLSVLAVGGAAWLPPVPPVPVPPVPAAPVLEPPVPEPLPPVWLVELGFGELQAERRRPNRTEQENERAK